MLYIDWIGMLLMELEMVSRYSIYTESFIKIQHQEVCQDSTYPPSHFLESWRKGMFLMELEIVSRNLIYPREVSLKVSARSNIRKLVKTPPIFQVSSWSFGGKG